MTFPDPHGQSFTLTLSICSHPIGFARPLFAKLGTLFFRSAIALLDYWAKRFKLKLLQKFPTRMRKKDNAFIQPPQTHWSEVGPDPCWPDIGPCPCFHSLQEGTQAIFFA
jgi:hypothetical protein